MRLAPWVPYGEAIQSTLVAKDVDLSKVVLSPILGADLASFRFK